MESIPDLQLPNYSYCDIRRDLWNFFLHSFIVFIYLLIVHFSRETYKGVLRNPNWVTLA
jgi:hypothetical protein